MPPPDSQLYVEKKEFRGGGGGGRHYEVQVTCVDATAGPGLRGSHIVKKVDFTQRFQMMYADLYNTLYSGDS